MIKDIYAKALLIPENELLIIKYSFGIGNEGRLQLSDSVKYLQHDTTEQLKVMLRNIEPFAITFYTIPKGQKNK
jgi:hypothetical protein